MTPTELAKREEKHPIKRLTLYFPYGESVEVCDRLIKDTQDRFRSGISEGGMEVTYTPMTKEDEKHRGCEFADDAMSYTYGYLKEKQ